MEKELNIILRAVKEGCDIDPESTIMDACDTAENYLMESIDFDRLEECELSCHRDQYYCFEGKEVWGDIFDFTARCKAEDKVFLRLSDMSFVDWFDVPSDGPERKEYGFVFAKEFDKDGQIVALYDRFE